MLLQESNQRQGDVTKQSYCYNPKVDSFPTAVSWSVLHHSGAD